MARPEVNTYPVPLNGKLIQSVDGMLIGTNFQTLKNLRYTSSNVKAIQGMTKINSTPVTNISITNGYHYIKPDESHVLIHGQLGSNSSLYESTDAIPNPGTFSELYINDGSATGYFSNAPQGEVIFCNETETLIWGGNSSRVAGFVTTNAAETFFRDYTEEVNNELDDDNNIALIGSAEDAADSSTMLLLHLNDDVVDASPTTPHTVTNNSVTFDAGDKVFGTHSAVFDGSTSYLSIPDDPDFDFSGGSWTVEGRYKFTSIPSGFHLYEHKTDDNNGIRLAVTGTGSLSILVYSGGTLIVSVTSAGGVVSTGTWYHIAYVQSGNSWYIFLDGVLVANTNNTSRCSNYTGTVYLGRDTSVPVSFFHGKMDEVRISNTARWTSNFTLPSAEYGVATSASSVLYIGSLLPIKGYTLNIKTSNTSTGTLSTEYWSNDAWNSVTNESDGTASGGITLAQSGDVTFDSTHLVSKIKSVNSLLIYWYKVSITAIDATTSIYNMKLSYDMQSLKDIWDGAQRTCFNFQIIKSGVYYDNTLNITEIDYSSANTATYADASSLGTSDYLLCGFNERITGVSIIFAEGNVNSNASTIAVSYWDGSAWVAATGIDDGTVEGTTTLAKSGSITWSSPEKKNEFKTEIAKETARYYYKISFSAALSTTIYIDQLTGIPAQTEIEGFNFPAYGLGRVWLCKDNYAFYSAFGTTQVFNGEDSDTVYFGDSKPLTTATTLYSQFGSSLFDVMVFTKKDETWILVSDGGEINRFQVSKSIGCVAPLTMQSTHIEGELAPGLNRNVAIWQGAQGVYLFDGRVPLPIHKDIDIYFDRTYSDSINLSYIDKSVGFFNEDGTEYHWLFASGTSTTLNKEMVFDVTKQRWFEIDRGTKKIQTGFKVQSSVGAGYTYGADNSGYVYRLENGTDFDGSTMNYQFRIGDVILSDEFTETEVRDVKLFTKSKTSGNDITITHYGDSSTTGTSYTASHDKTGYRVNDTSQDNSFKHHILHSIDVSTSNTSEDIGFEPLHMALGFKLTRR